MIIHIMGVSGCGLNQINPVEGRQVAQVQLLYQWVSSYEYLPVLSMGA